MERAAQIKQRRWLDWCFHTQPFAAYLVFGPLIFFLLGYHFKMFSFGVWGSIGLFMLGLLHWTFDEYIWHRFVFHSNPASPFWRQLACLAHENHHEEPRNPFIVSGPPLLTLPLSMVKFAFLYVILGDATFVFFAGHITAYLYYEYVHYGIHHQKSFAITHAQRKRHLVHHFKTEDHSFGISTGLWDWVFRTKAL